MKTVITQLIAATMYEELILCSVLSMDCLI